MPRLKLLGSSLTPDIEKRAEIELGETQEVRIKSLEQIKCLIKEEPDFSPCMDEAFLLLFLRKTKFNLKDAFKQLKTHYIYKAKNWGIICGFKPSDYKKIWEEEYGLVLEYMDDNDCAVAIHRFGMVDLDKYKQEVALTYALHSFEVGSQSIIASITGYVMIHDYADFTLKQMMQVAKPSIVKGFIGIMQDCAPNRLKAIHVINAPAYFNIMLRVAKIFLPEKLSKRIHVHGDLESLHGCVTPDILPREYGGNQGPWSECVKKFAFQVFSHDTYIDEMNKYGYKGKTLQNLRNYSAKPIISTT